MSDAMHERVAVLESGMESLLGNGQPGRVAKIERDVAWLQKMMNRFVGVAIALNGVAVVADIVIALLKFR